MGTRTQPVCGMKALWIVAPLSEGNPGQRDFIKACDRCLPNVLGSRNEVTSINYMPREEPVTKKPVVKRLHKPPDMSNINDPRRY